MVGVKYQEQVSAMAILKGVGVQERGKCAAFVA